MASINFTQPIFVDRDKQYTYSDIHLDLQQDQVLITIGGKKQKNDIKSDYNVDAIKNSIFNLFNTRKGQRILLPEYGLNLDQYIFERMSREIAYSIGEDIRIGIQRYEPRVTPLKINVSPSYDINTYEVTIVLYIPALSINTNISGNITSAGFIIR